MESVQFYGQFHTWRLSQILQKGTQRTDQTLRRDLARALTLVGKGSPIDLARALTLVGKGSPVDLARALTLVGKGSPIDLARALTLVGTIMEFIW